MRVSAQPRKWFHKKRYLIPGTLLLVLAALWLYLWMPRPLPPLVIPTGEPQSSAWEDWGGSRGGSRYAPIGQIRPNNVMHLQVAWTYSSGEMKRRSAAMLGNSTVETTPILAAGSLVTCTPFGRIIALDPQTGREKWAHESKIDPNFVLPNQYICRGVSQWIDTTAPAGAPCRHRIIAATVDLRMIAIDATNGKSCPGFGQDGAIKVVEAVPPRHLGELKLASPPAIVGDVAVVGSMVLDNVRAAAPRGTINGYDVRTGALLWAFEPIPQDSGPTDKDWLGDARHHAGAANMWSVMSVDTARNLVFVPTSSASPDYYGGLRPGDNRYANSIVALDGKTGKVVWHQQLVHHDIWDYDTPAQPVLVDIQRGGATIPAVVQPTKQGFTFVFDRRNGTPLFPIDERPVPQGAVQGEWLSKTQPVPRLPKPLFSTRLRPEDAWGFTPWDRGKCRDLIAAHRYEGLFTPPSTKGTITYPAASGGANWGSASVDPTSQIMFVNSSRVASLITLIPRRKSSGNSVELTATADVSPMDGTPFEVKREFLLSPLGAPCTPPPWGGLTAIDLKTGKTLWDVPLGTIDNKLPFKPALNWKLGTPNIGGTIVTRGGVLFVAATMDGYLRAFDMRTGAELWKGKLPAGSQSTPMTYMAGGRQFVVMATGQHMWFQTPAGDSLVAYALPLAKR